METVTAAAETLARLLVFVVAGLLWGASVWQPPGRPLERVRIVGASLALALILGGSWVGLPLGPWLAAAGVGLLALGFTAELRLLTKGIRE
jgi:hypothetical protein